MDENSPEAIFNRMMEQAQDARQAAFNAQYTQQPQQGGQQPAPNVPTGMPGQPPVLSVEEQRLLNQLNLNTSGHGSTSTVSATNPNCPDCGMIHPPLRPGEKCPNAKSKVTDKDKKEIDINKYLVIWRDVILSNIDKRKITNPEKMFQQITIEVTKFAEGYTE
jgi:hypothetical protein